MHISSDKLQIHKQWTAALTSSSKIGIYLKLETMCSCFTGRISTLLVTLMTQKTHMIRISSMTDSEDLESVKGSGFAISNF